MVGTFSPIYRCEGPLFIQGICACPGAHWGKSNRNVTGLAEYFLVRARVIGTCPGSCWEVQCRTTAQRSPVISHAIAVSSWEIEQDWSEVDIL